MQGSCDLNKVQKDLKQPGAATERLGTTGCRQSPVWLTASKRPLWGGRGWY